MKRHKKLGINALARCCVICGKPIAYSIYGDTTDVDVSLSSSLLRGVCSDCKDKLEENDAFVSCDIKNDEIQRIHRYFFYRHDKLKELFKDTDDIHIINHISKENFDKMFDDILKDYENENSRAKR